MSNNPFELRHIGADLHDSLYDATTPSRPKASEVASKATEERRRP